MCTTRRSPMMQTAVKKKKFLIDPYLAQVQRGPAGQSVRHAPGSGDQAVAEGDHEPCSQAQDRDRGIGRAADQRRVPDGAERPAAVHTQHRHTRRVRSSDREEDSRRSRRPGRRERSESEFGRPSQTVQRERPLRRGKKLTTTGAEMCIYFNIKIIF